MKTRPAGTGRGENTAFEARKAKLDKLRKEEQRQAIYLVLAEVLFILLPFLAIGTVFYFKGRLHELFTQPEWALAASVISGQAVVKFVSGFLSAPFGRIAWQKISLWITLVIVFSVTPSLLVLTLILNGEQTHASIALVRSQIILFFWGLLIFICCGWLGEALRALAKFEQETASPRSGDAREFADQKPSTAQPPAKGAGNHHPVTQAEWNATIEAGVKAQQQERNPESPPA